MTDRPLLYLDVDGPLNPYAAKARRRVGYTLHKMLPPTWIAQSFQPPERVKPLPVWLNPAHGPKLVALAEHYDLWWATTWEHDANEWIGSHLGLPELPVVEWDHNRSRLNSHGAYWKTPQLIEHAAGRPFAWVDDEITRRDRSYVETFHDGRALLHRVEASLGLVDDDFTRLAEWATCQGDVQGSAA